MAEPVVQKQEANPLDVYKSLAIQKKTDMVVFVPGSKSVAASSYFITKNGEVNQIALKPEEAKMLETYRRAAMQNKTDMIVYLSGAAPGNYLVSKDGNVYKVLTSDQTYQAMREYLYPAQPPVVPRKTEKK